MSTVGSRVQSPVNYEQKCCCVLVFDVSGSMQGAPIKELNAAMRSFYKDIQEDITTANRLEVAIVEFSDTVKTLIEPSLVATFDMPTLVTKGTTKLVDGARQGIQIVRNRKDWYKTTGQPYYRPWIILFTDGMPDDDQDITGLIGDIRDGVNKKEFFFFPVGVQNGDMNFLTRISDPSMPPAKLQGLKFYEFFKWLSASMSCITQSKSGETVNLPDPSAWMSGFKI